MNATPTSSTQLRSNAELYTALLKRVALLEKQASRERPAGPIQEPRVVCHIQGTRALVDGKLWGRRSLQECTDWTFEAGDVLTTIGFHGPMPGHPGKALAMQHLHWYMFYAPRSGHSQSSIVYGDQCGYVHKKPNSHSWHRAPVPNRTSFLSITDAH